MSARKGMRRPSDARKRRIDASSPETWPVVWRVVAPNAGGYSHDMVFITTEDETEAHERFEALCSGGYPVRLERIQCGPLPADSQPKLAELRRANGQNPGQEELPTIQGYWTVSTQAAS
jgi:hypothetical protein